MVERCTNGPWCFEVNIQNRHNKSENTPLAKWLHYCCAFWVTKRHAESSYHFAQENSAASSQCTDEAQELGKQISERQIMRHFKSRQHGSHLWYPWAWEDKQLGVQDWVWGTKAITKAKKTIIGEYARMIFEWLNRGERQDKDFFGT